MAQQGRNDLCSCGSGRKFKKCCGMKPESKRTSRMLIIAVGGTLLAALAAGIASFTTERTSSMRVWDPAHGHYHDASGVEVP